MKIKLLPLLSFLSVALLASTLLACGGMSHDHGSGESSSSSMSMESAKPAAATGTLIAPYLSIRASLAGDSITDIATQAEVFAAALRAAAPVQDKEAAEKSDKNKAHKLAKKGLKIMKKIPCADHAAMMIEDQFFSDETSAGAATLEKLQQSAQKLTNRNLTLQETRNNFAAMSDAFIAYIKENPAAAQADGLQLYFCPMANHYWLQKAGEPIGNPFFGSKMPGCGEQTTLAAATAKIEGAGAAPSSEHKHN